MTSPLRSVQKQHDVQQEDLPKLSSTAISRQSAELDRSVKQTELFLSASQKFKGALRHVPSRGQLPYC